VTWRNFWPSGACTSIMSRCGDGLERYAPEMERRLRSKLKPTGDSWRVDEMYVRVKGKWVYLYRALDSLGSTIDFLLWG
jgi:transposase-like protein